MNTRLVFELDVAPPNVSPASAVDFAGRLVAAFRSTPLFRYPEWGRNVRPGLVENFERRQSGREWTFYCRRGTAGSKRESFTREHLLALLTPRSSTQVTTPASQFIAREVQNIEAHGLSGVRLSLRRPIPFLPEILSSDLFSCVDACTDQIFTGPYDLLTQVAGRVVALAKNDVGRALYPEGPNEIFFVVTRSPEDGVRLFEQGLVDVTCNPNLPISVLSRYGSTGQLRTGRLAMAGVIIARDPADVRPLSQTIRRESICQAAGPGVLPLRRVMDVFNTEQASTGTPSEAASPPQTRISTGKRHLTLAYADFEPNEQVVSALAENMQDALSIRLELHSLGYADYLRELRTRSFDLIYTLVQPRLPEPVMFLEQLLRWRGPGARPVAADTSELMACSYEQRVARCSEIFEAHADSIPLIPVVRHTSKFLASAAAQNLFLSEEGLMRPILHHEDDQ